MNAPLCIAGSICFWTWVDCFLFTPALLLPFGAPQEFFVRAFLCAVPICSAVLLLGAFKPRIAKLLGNRGTSLYALGMLAVFSGALVLYAGWKESLPVLMLGSVGNGVVFGAGVLAWGVVYASGGAKGASVHVPAAFAFSAAASFVISRIEPVLGAAVIVFLPSVSFAILTHLNGSPALPPRKPSTTDSPSPCRRFGLTWNIVVSFFIFGLAYGFMQFQSVFGSGLAPAQDSLTLLVVRGVTSLALFVGTAFFAWKIHVVYRIGLAVMIAGFMVMPFSLLSQSTGSFLPGAIVMAGYTCFDVMCWIVLAEIGYCSPSGAQGPVGLGRALVHAGVAAGMLAGLVLTSMHFSPMVQAVLTTSMGYLLVIAVILVIGDNYGLWSLLRYGTTFEGEVIPTPDGHGHLLALFAARNGLSAREVEVLEPFSTGRSTRYIAELLSISENTVKSHVRHIYTKCGVHDRQELLDAISTVSTARQEQGEPSALTPHKQR